MLISPVSRPDAAVWSATCVVKESTAATGRGVAQLGGTGVIWLLTSTRLPHPEMVRMPSAVTVTVMANRARRTAERRDIGGESYPDAGYNRSSRSSQGAPAAIANTIKESKGVASQRDIVTHVRCPICNNLMRQNEIGVEIASRHSRPPGEPRRERIIKHTKNCKAA